MTEYIKGQLVKVAKQDGSQFWPLAEDTAMGVYLGFNNDPEDAPHVHMIAIPGFEQVHIMSEEEVSAA